MTAQHKHSFIALLLLTNCKCNKTASSAYSLNRSTMMIHILKVWTKINYFTLNCFYQDILSQQKEKADSWFQWLGIRKEAKGKQIWL